MGEADACDENRVTSFPLKEERERKNLARFGDSIPVPLMPARSRSAGEIKKHSFALLFPPCPVERKKTKQLMLLWKEEAIQNAHATHHYLARLRYLYGSQRRRDPMRSNDKDCNSKTTAIQCNLLLILIRQSCRKEPKKLKVLQSLNSNRALFLFSRGRMR